MDKSEYIKKWSEKLSLSVEFINDELDKLVEEEKSIHSDLSSEVQQQRALQRLALTYKKQLRSPAVGFEGVVIGVSDCVDTVARQRREAIILYKQDPQSAISQGITDEEGTPLDTRQEFASGKSNFRFGQPLPENNLLRNIFGIAVKSGKAETKPTFFIMTISGSNANDDNIPTFVPVRFMAIDKSTNPESMLNLSSSQFTRFVVDNNLKLPPYRELLMSCCKNMMVDLKGLEDYHNKTKDNFNRIVITEGDVSSLNLQPTSMGSRIMTIEDINQSLEDLDAKGVTCWMPLRCEIDFAEGSKVLVVGRTAQGKKKDEQGNITEELGDVSINVMGLYALPEYKIKIPEQIQTITEESIDFI